MNRYTSMLLQLRLNFFSCIREVFATISLGTQSITLMTFTGWWWLGANCSNATSVTAHTADGFILAILY